MMPALKNNECLEGRRHGEANGEAARRHQPALGLPFDRCHITHVSRLETDATEPHDSVQRERA